MTLGGWLAGGIAWHISLMWVLFADGLAYLIYGAASSNRSRPLRPRR
jgi:thiosulfate reductase cytochrome b subunit